MIEIRPIREGESSTFLRLLCSVFGLDFNRASSVFFREPFFELGRKWALFEDSQMRSILTTTPLEFGWGRAIGIAGVATTPASQGQGFAGQVLRKVLEHSASVGEEPALLFAHQTSLYESVGFAVIDQMVRGKIKGTNELIDLPELSMEKTKAIYSKWAAEDSGRLVREKSRWEFWEWGMRNCYPVRSGYFCLEGSVVREAIVEPNLAAWPVPAGTDWVGLESITESLGVPLLSRKSEMILMGRRFPSPPQMFMTDQF